MSWRADGCSSSSSNSDCSVNSMQLRLRTQYAVICCMHTCLLMIILQFVALCMQTMLILYCVITIVMTVERPLVCVTVSSSGDGVASECDSAGRGERESRSEGDNALSRAEMSGVLISPAP